MSFLNKSRSTSAGGRVRPFYTDSVNLLGAGGERGAREGGGRVLGMIP